MKHNTALILAGAAVVAYLLYKRNAQAGLATDLTPKSLVDSGSVAPPNFDPYAAVAAMQAANRKRLSTLATERALAFNAQMARMGNPARVEVPYDIPHPVYA